MKKIPVAVVGATGLVGQKLIEMIESEPSIQLVEVAASQKSVGKQLGHLKLQSIDSLTAPYILSALPASVAETVEPMLAGKGLHVISNASAHRMKENIPLVIPEINRSHLSLLNLQKTAGKIITNPNCSTVFVALALHPLRQLGEIVQVNVMTMQALSGAGQKGFQLDIEDNLIPYIAGEEEKIEKETLKILAPANFHVMAHCNRVPITHGHTVVLHVQFKEDVSAKEAEQLFQEKPYVYYKNPSEPQPGRHITPFDQSVHIGRIKQGGKKNELGLIAMGHNLVRGAAGATLLNLKAALEVL